MEKEVKYFMLSDEDLKFANVYCDISRLKEDYNKLSEKIKLKTFILTPTEGKEDLVIAKLNNHLFACLGPKIPVEGDSYIKVKLNEIKIRQKT